MDSFGVPRQRGPASKEAAPASRVPAQLRRGEESRQGSESDLPRRGGANARLGVRTAIFGSLPSQVRQARAWCRKSVPVDPLRALRVEVVAGELMANALIHSASGLAGGHIRVEMERLTNRLFRIAVTDDGPRPGLPLCLPSLPQEVDQPAVCGRGLRLVDRLSTSWGWEGEPGRPLTVWANLDPYVPVPDTAQV